jgi:hypothetical protein
VGRFGRLGQRGCPGQPRHLPTCQITFACIV